MWTWLVSTIYTLTLNLPELVPVRHGHPRPPEGPRPRRGAAESQIRRQSTGTRSGDLRPSEAYALPIQDYHLDLSTGVLPSRRARRTTPLFNSPSTPRTHTTKRRIRKKALERKVKSRGDSGACALGTGSSVQSFLQQETVQCVLCAQQEFSTINTNATEI